MKLARKITLALALLAVGVLALMETLEVRRELERSAEDMRHDHQLLGHTIAGSIAKAWQQAGEEEALSLLDQANRFQDQVRLGWVWLDAPPFGHMLRLPLPPEVLTPLRLGQETAVTDVRVPPGLLRSYIPVSVNGRLGAIEISESLIDEQKHVRSTVLRTTLGTLAIGLGFLVAAMAMGRQLVGRPIEQLVLLARRIGEGHLDARVHLHQRDELDTLALEMNQMGEQLQRARETIATETAARLAALEHLRHADRLTTVGKLASGVAHELGTPLNVVLGRSKMISSGEAEGDEVRECAQIISQQAQHMTRIIRQLLDFARRRSPQRAPEELSELVTRTLSLLQPMASKRSVRIVSEVPESLTLQVDTGQLQQVLTNLVMNGLQAMKNPGTLRVGAGLAQATAPAEAGGTEAEWVRVDVMDEGEGIAPEVLPHIFEPFFTTKDVGEGTGLGLSVSYGIIRDHGGWIAVRSEPEKGSCFSVYLPKEESACQAAS